MNLEQLIKDQLKNVNGLRTKSDLHDLIFGENDLLEQHAKSCGIDRDSFKWNSMRNLQNDVIADFLDKQFQQIKPTFKKLDDEKILATFLNSEYVLQRVNSGLTRSSVGEIYCAVLPFVNHFYDLFCAVNVPACEAN